MCSIYRLTARLIVVEVHNRSPVDLFAVDEVVDHANNCHTSEHDDTIVHVSNRWVGEKWKEANDCLQNAVADGDGIDWDTLH